MNRYMLIRLSRDANNSIVATWMGCDARGAATAPPLAGSLREAAMQTGRGEVVVLVPSDDVVHMRAELPARTSGRWQLAVPYAIEEQLAENIEDMHVAVGERGNDAEPVPVSVIARARIQEYLDALQGAGIAASRMYAESSLLPVNPGQVVALLLGDTIQVRMPDGAHCSVPADPLGAAFDIACPGEATQRSLLLYAAQADWQSRSDGVNALRERFLTVKVQLLPQGPLPVFAQQLPSARPINLLQGDYEPVSAARADWRDWRLPAALAAALLLVVAGGQWLQWSRARAAEKDVDARLADLGRSLLGPAAPSDPGQVRRAAQGRLSGGQGGDTALEMMAALATARSAAPQSRLESLRYQDGRLELRIRADSADSLERINAQLRSGGWRAELTSGSAGKEGYDGQIRVSRDGAS